jgi:membrane protease subunit HflC
VIDQVTRYDKRLRLLRTRSVTQQTADDSQIIVETFALWRVADPYVFFQRFRSAGDRPEDHFIAADDVLRSRLMSALSETSRFRIDDLFSPEQGTSQLPELEKRMLAAVIGSADVKANGLDQYGIEVTFVGINRVLLPEETTTKVVERMGANRDRIAQEITSQADAEARAIIAQANADAEKIKTFARRRASEIVARGESEAAVWLSEQNSDADLAVFLQQIEFMKDAMARRLTLVLATSDFGMELFSPQALRGLKPGTFPIRGAMSAEEAVEAAATEAIAGEASR